MTIKDITPEGSVVPIYLDTTPKEPLDTEEVHAQMKAVLAAREAARDSAIAKLRKLGLTEEEALAIAGG